MPVFWCRSGALRPAQTGRETLSPGLRPKADATKPQATADELQSTAVRLQSTAERLLSTVKQLPLSVDVLQSAVVWSPMIRRLESNRSSSSSNRPSLGVQSTVDAL